MTTLDLALEAGIVAPEHDEGHHASGAPLHRYPALLMDDFPTSPTTGMYSAADPSSHGRLAWLWKLKSHLSHCPWRAAHALELARTRHGDHQHYLRSAACCVGLAALQLLEPRR